MKARAKFGPAGNAESFFARGYKTYEDIPQYTIEMGLDCFEYQCGRGVKIRTENARVLGKLAAEAGIAMSIHTPYYISLSGEDEQKRKSSARYLLESAEAITAMGGRRMVMHSGSVGHGSRAAALALAKETLYYCIKQLDAAGFRDVTICPETMGKMNQLGDLDEVMELCSIDERLIPCIDFGHLNARTQGGLGTKAAFAAILDTMEKRLGRERAKVFHAHFSKIEYTASGERRHLTFTDTTFGPEPLPLLELVAERALAPTLICESAGTQAEDAAEMKRIYLELLDSHSS